MAERGFQRQYRRPSIHRNPAMNRDSSWSNVESAAGLQSGSTSSAGIGQGAVDEITLLLQRARNGEPEQLDRVFAALYMELRRVAESRLGSGCQTLTPTALVHEVFLTLRGNESLNLNDRRHFFACAARSMRCIVVDHARRRSADRRGGGATPVTLAILAQAKLQAKLVHYDHSSHLAQNDSDQYGDMIASTTGHLSEFGFDQNVVFDDQTQLSAAVANIAKVIDASTASDPLTFIVAGPFEVTYQGVAAASADKLQYVTLLSHSTWNEDHEHVPAEHTKDELLADFPAVKFIKISDQNANAFKSSPSAWDWMNAAGADLTWVRGRMVQAEYAEGDNSDAGMAFYLVTGNEKATMNDIKTFFGQ